MKKKTIHKGTHKKSKKKIFPHGSRYIYFRYGVIAAILLVVVFVGKTLYTHIQATHVLGATTYLADNGGSEGGDNTTTSGDNNNSNASGDTATAHQETPDKVEVTDTPEPTDVPEKVQAVEKVQQEITKQVENNNVNQVEVQPPVEGSDSGKVILQQTQGTTQEIQTPTSNTTQVTQITDPQAGTVSVHVGGPNNITINNGPYTITTQYPVIINPQDQTMAIRTPSGVTVLKTFPSQAFQNVPPQSKLSSVNSVSLTDQQGTPIYQADGIQVRKFLGIMPVQANVSESINAQTGQVVNTTLPWYYSLFGFAFSQT